MNPTPVQSLSCEHDELIGAVENWRADSLIHGVAWLLVLTAVQRLIGFLRAILFCRWLDAEQLGLWDMTFGFLMLAGPLVVLALPGAFGRYAENYRLRGQLRPFLRRTTAACAFLALAAVALIALSRRWFSELLFGSPQQTRLILWIALGLIAVAAYNYCISLFIAIKSVRLAAVMEFLNGVLFAVLGIGILWSWQRNAVGAVLAYSGAGLLSVCCASWWMLSVWKASPRIAEPLPRRALWSKLVPFAAWILLINLLTNLFGIADRYMIIHFAPGGSDETLALVGAYHSSRVVPLLLFSLASMLGTMLLPHLCHDWESGRRDLVCARLNLFLKLLAFALMAASAATLFIAPWMFAAAFQGKFAGGLAVLPWTLTYCIWFAVAMVAQQYLWCAEKGGLIGLALTVGLAINVALNVWLLPRLGLLAAALSATAANLVALVLILCLSRLLGLRIHRGLWIILGLVPVLSLGPWVTVITMSLLALEALRCEQILTGEEKHLLWESLKHYGGNLRNFLTRLLSRRSVPIEQMRRPSL